MGAGLMTRNVCAEVCLFVVTDIKTLYSIGERYNMYGQRLAQSMVAVL